MAGPQRNGVDATIALLLALARRNGEAKASILQSEIGAPRSSFHRIVRTLTAAGILESPRGLLRVGRIAEPLIAANAAALNREGGGRAPRGSRSSRGPTVSRTAEALDPGPIALSRAIAPRRAARFRIGFSNASMDNSWRVALVHGVEYAAAAFGDRIERLTVLHAKDDWRQQEADIRGLIDQGVDGLIVSAVTPGDLRGLISLAMARGIAVVFVDRGVEPDVPRTSFVSADDATIGGLTALWLAEKLGGAGSILLLPGDGAAKPAQLRLAAARSIFSAFGGINVLAVEWTGWRQESGRRIMRAALERWGAKIDGVWCDSGLQGAGSMQAFIDAGYRAGDIPPHTGGDLNLAYKLAIRWRTPLAAVDYPPSMGIKALEVLLAAMRGAWTPASVKLACDVIIAKGCATRSVTPDLWAEDHVRWDLPDDLILGSCIGPAYNPRSFRIHYPGNVYNRSAAQAARRLQA
jgi:ribose transport system substrate-binding protein